MRRVVQLSLAGRVATTASVTSVTFTGHRPRALDQNFDVYRTLGLLPKSTRIIVVVAGPRLPHVSTPHRLIQHECHKYGRSALQGIHTSLHQISFVPFRFVIITITHQNGTHTKCWCWLTTLHFTWSLRDTKLATTQLLRFAFIL